MVGEGNGTQEIPVAIREQSGVLCFHSRWMPVSRGASGMQPRDRFRPWRGTLASGHKPRCTSIQNKANFPFHLPCLFNGFQAENSWTPLLGAPGPNVLFFQPWLCPDLQHKGYGVRDLMLQCLLLICKWKGGPSMPQSLKEWDLNPSLGFVSHV